MFRVFIAGSLVLGAFTWGLAMPAPWNVRESRNFVCYYRNADKEFVDLLIRRSEECYRSISRNLGLAPGEQRKGQNRFKVYIYDNAQQYWSETGQPEWSDGSSIQRLRTIFSFPGANNFFDSVFAHELAHIIFREEVGFENKSIPVWLEEGVGVSQERRDPRALKEQNRDYLDKGLFIELGLLEDVELRTAADQQRIDLFFAQAGSVVRYLLSEFGPARFRLFCRSLSNGQDLEKALDRTYGFRSISELDRAWQSYLQKK